MLKWVLTKDKEKDVGVKPAIIPWEEIVRLQDTGEPSDDSKCTVSIWSNDEKPSQIQTAEDSGAHASDKFATQATEEMESDICVAREKLSAMCLSAVSGEVSGDVEQPEVVVERKHSKNSCSCEEDQASPLDQPDLNSENDRVSAPLSQDEIKIDTSSTSIIAPGQSNSTISTAVLDSLVSDAETKMVRVLDSYNVLHHEPPPDCFGKKLGKKRKTRTFELLHVVTAGLALDGLTKEQTEDLLIQELMKHNDFRSVQAVSSFVAARRLVNNSKT